MLEIVRRKDEETAGTVPYSRMAHPDVPPLSRASPSGNRVFDLLAENGRAKVKNVPCPPVQSLGAAFEKSPAKGRIEVISQSPAHQQHGNFFQQGRG